MGPDVELEGPTGFAVSVGGCARTQAPASKVTATNAIARTMPRALTMGEGPGASPPESRRLVFIPGRAGSKLWTG